MSPPTYPAPLERDRLMISKTDPHGIDPLSKVSTNKTTRWHTARWRRHLLRL